MNILYVGSKNPVCIAVPKYASTDFYATISEGEIIRKDECFTVTVHTYGEKQICVMIRKPKKV